MDRPARFKLPGTSPTFKIHWPANQIEAAMHGIVVDRKAVFEIQYKESDLEPVVISGVFRALDGSILCEIFENELIAVPGRFGDFFCSGNRFQFLDKKRRKSLKFRLGTGGLTIENISHVSGGAMILGNSDGLWVSNGVRTILFRDIDAQDCRVAIAVQPRWIQNYETFDISKDPMASSMQRFKVVGAHTAVSL